MDRLNDLLLAGKIRAEHGLDAFLSEERGDTNFISMLIIIAIAVFLGGLFKPWARVFSPRCRIRSPSSSTACKGKPVDCRDQQLDGAGPEGRALRRGRYKTLP